MSLRPTLLAFGTVAAVFLGGGCHSDPYCLNCTTGSTIDLAGVDQQEPPDLFGLDLATVPDLTGAPCTPSNSGIEICDNLDNDCNGITDDVAAAKLAGDPNNCGKCGNACNFTGQKQFGVCDNSTGTPTCKPGACLPGYVDTDGDPSNGCDYECTPTNGGVEICDGIDNNCDKVVDNGFDKQNDPKNCGGCGIICPAVAGNSVGSCVAGMCQAPICDAGYKNLNGNPNDGCEYKCPVFPTVPETCDGVDQDCDGVKDNAPTDVGSACSNFCGTVAPCVATNSCSYSLSTNHGGNCYGQCFPGMTICAGGTITCQATLPIPSLEKCDGVDNNCDGQIDEGFNKQTDPLNCNVCGNKCAVTTNAASVLAYKCTVGVCGIAACQPGFKDLNGTFSDGCEYACPVNPPTTESCNGKDDDCDGLVDEIAGAVGNLGSVITAPSNFCFQGSICATAAPVCCGTSGWLCDFKSVNAGVEVQEAAGAGLTCKRASDGAARIGGTLVFAETKCDGLDGDCRNGADDSFTQKGKACTNGVGACAGTSNYVCGGSSAVGACSGSNNTTVCCPVAAIPGNATAEQCNGIDDNCDGNIDERTPSATGGPYLAGYVDRFVKVRNSPELWVYAYEASRTDAVAGSAGTASSGRACAKPGVKPWASVTEAQALAACQSIKLANNTTARLCTAAEWQLACEGPTPGPAPEWSLSSTPAAYVAQVCNDVNRTGGPAVWVTGNDNGQAQKCFVDWNGAPAGGEIYDLSGNLMEWMSDAQVLGAKTYYSVRGGAYNAPSGGTTCEFSFNILPAGFFNNDVGFRCCADSAP